jgi:hypothetical protein
MPWKRLPFVRIFRNGALTLVWNLHGSEHSNGVKRIPTTWLDFFSGFRGRLNRNDFLAQSTSLVIRHYRDLARKNSYIGATRG